MIKLFILLMPVFIFTFGCENGVSREEHKLIQKELELEKANHELTRNMLTALGAKNDSLIKELARLQKIYTTSAAPAIHGKWIRESDGTVIEVKNVDGLTYGIITTGSGNGRWKTGDRKWKSFRKISNNEYEIEELLKNEQGDPVKYASATLVMVNKDILRGVSGEGLGTDKWTRVK